MSKARKFINLILQEGSSDLNDVLREFEYGLSIEMDNNPNNKSSGVDASTMFELSSDKGDNWIELQLWDKNRFDTPIGTVRFVCSMESNDDFITLTTGKGLEKIKFNSKEDEINSLDSLQDKDSYKHKIKSIGLIFLGFKLNAKGITEVSNDSNSFEQIGRRVGKGLIDKCYNLLK